MKKIIPMLLVIIAITTSCDIQYNGDVRIQFKGKVVNEFNEPLANQSVRIFAENDNPYGEINMIGIGNTDANGNYALLIPEAKFFDFYSLEINEDAQPTSELTSTKFVKIKNSNFFNYNLQLPTTKLFLKSNLSNLHVIFTISNSQRTLENVEYIGEVPNEIFSFTYENPFFEQMKRVKKNQTIEVKYKYFDFNTQTHYTLSSFVTIDNSDDIYHTITI